MSLGKSILWVFGLDSGPFFDCVSGFLLFVLLFPLPKRKSGWGFAGRRGLVVLCVFFFLIRFACSYGPIVSLYMPVRTRSLVEPKVEVARDPER